MSDARAAARRLADEVLWPAADQVDATGVLPPGHIDAIAAAGLYGLFGPPELGGVASDTDAYRVVETLAGGCLATTFVWLQHLGVVRAVSVAPPPLRRTYLADLCAGTVRSAVAIGALRPGPPALRARPVADGWVLDGEAPWVTGWGLADLVHVAARTDDDTVVWALVDAHPGAGLAADRLDLAVLRAATTVRLRFDGVVVPADRVTARTDFADWPARDAAGLRTNGCLALGLADRCVRQLGGALRPAEAPLARALAAELDELRAAADEAGADELPGVRARSAELALRAATSYAVAAGAGGTLRGEPVQRLVREATFLLVFASRPAIRQHLLTMVPTPPVERAPRKLPGNTALTAT